MQIYLTDKMCPTTVDRTPMNILLTGASGFAGAHMLKYLLENSPAEIYCPVTYKHGGHAHRIPDLIDKSLLERVHIFEFDLAEAELSERIVDVQIDLVINFASESHVDRSIINPKEFNLNNSSLMINLLEYVRKMKNSPAFVHISTDEVYGSIPSGERNVEWERIHLPSNPYSAGKSGQESLAIAYFKTYKIPLAIINSTNMVGEAQNQEKYIPKAITKILHDEILTVDTDPDGNMGSRKYVYVGDVASAVWRTATHLMNQQSDSDIEKPLKVHIAGEIEVTNLQLALFIGEVLGLEPRIEISPSPRPGYDLRYELDTERIRRMGWTQQESIYDSLKAIVDWTLEHRNWLEADHVANSELN